MLTFLPGFLRPSREGTLCLHPLERAPGAFVSDASPVSRALLVLCVNQGQLEECSVHPISSRDANDSLSSTEEVSQLSTSTSRGAFPQK